MNPEDWTSGFFPGSLWYLYEYTQEPKWLAAATNYTLRLDRIKNFRGHHDVGFMLYCSYGNGLRLTQEAAYRDGLLQGAKSLASRYQPEVGLIRSWDFGKWKYPVIVDNMMNLELLMWTAKNGGEARLREISLSPADKTMQNHFRPDHSSFHLVDYHPTNGAVLHKQTVRGAADDSAWARGQAWGLVWLHGDGARDGPGRLPRAGHEHRELHPEPSAPAGGQDSGLGPRRAGDSERAA